MKCFLHILLILHTAAYSQSFLERLNNQSIPVEHTDMYLKVRDLINDQGRRKLEAVIDSACQAPIFKKINNIMPRYEYTIEKEFGSLANPSEDLQKRFDALAQRVHIDPKTIQLKTFLNTNTAGFAANPNIIGINNSTHDNNIDLVLLHESTHQQHNDPTIISLAGAGGVVAGVRGAFKYLPKKYGIFAAAPIAIGIIAGRTMKNSYSKG